MNENNNLNNEFDNFDDDFAQIVVNNDPDEIITDTIIEINETDTVNKSSRKGMRVFIVALCIIVALSIAITGGYIAGRYSVRSSNNDGTLIELFSKSDAEKYSAESIYKKVNKSVVGIVVYNSEGIKGYASGVIYSEDGHIVSNDHIYEGVPDARFKIYTYDGKVYNGNYLAGDTRSDLSVIKVNSSGFFPATFGDSAEITCGEQVLAIGRPSDATSASSITSGIVSYVNRRVRNATNYSSKLIQTDSAINPGSSGGALVNMYGQVIGITSSKLVGEDYEAVGYAIPSATVKEIVESLIKNGKVVGRSRLGVSYQEVDSVTAEIGGSKIFGLKIAEVSKDSDLYGKVKEGDIITHVNGKAILYDDIILDIIENNMPGTEITLTVVNSSQKNITLKCKLLTYEGESSYKTTPNALTPDGDSSSGGTFDFPYGN